MYYILIEAVESRVVSSAWVTLPEGHETWGLKDKMGRLVLVRKKEGSALGGTVHEKTQAAAERQSAGTQLGLARSSSRKDAKGQRIRGPEEAKTARVISQHKGRHLRLTISAGDGSAEHWLAGLAEDQVQFLALMVVHNNLQLQIQGI